MPPDWLGASRARFQVKTERADGEMMVYDQRENRFLSKGSCVLDVKNLSGSTGSSPYTTRFCAFDIVYLNDRDLSHLPVGERLSILRNNVCSNPVVDVLKDLAVLENNKEGRSELRKLLEAQIALKEEGLVVKREPSTYQPNGRNCAGWFKLKPDYIDSLADDLDILLVGASYGGGKRKNPRKPSLESFAVAVKVDDTKFRLVSQVSSGFTNADIEYLSEHVFCDAQVRRTVPDDWMSLDRRSDKCALYLKEARFCPVAQVRVAEVSVDPKGRFGLRFPRLVCLRKSEDKSWSDACTVDDLEKISRKLTGLDTNPPVKHKRPKLVYSQSLALKMESIELASTTTKSDHNDKRLSGLEICLMLKDDAGEARSLKELIETNGGCCVKIPSKSRTWIVVMDNEDAQLQIGARSRRILRDFKVVSPDWLKEYIKGKCIDTIKYQQLAIREKLQAELCKIEPSADIDFDKLTAIGIDCGKFRGMRFASVDVKQALWMVDVKLNGGKIAENIDDATHVVCNDGRNIEGKITVNPAWIFNL